MIKLKGTINLNYDNYFSDLQIQNNYSQFNSDQILKYFNFQLQTNNGNDFNQLNALNFQLKKVGSSNKYNFSIALNNKKFDGPNWIETSKSDYTMLLNSLENNQFEIEAPTKSNDWRKKVLDVFVKKVVVNNVSSKNALKNNTSIQQANFARKKATYNLDELLNLDQKYQNYLKTNYDVNKIQIKPLAVNANDLEGKIFLKYLLVNPILNEASTEKYRSNPANTTISNFKKLDSNFSPEANNDSPIPDNKNAPTDFLTKIKNFVKSELKKRDSNHQINDKIKLSFSNSNRRWPTSNDLEITLLKEFSSEDSDFLSSVKKSFDTLNNLIRFTLNRKQLNNKGNPSIDFQSYIFDKSFYFESIRVKISKETVPILTRERNYWKYDVKFNYIISIPNAQLDNPNSKKDLIIPASYIARIFDDNFSTSK